MACPFTSCDPWNQAVASVLVCVPGRKPCPFSGLEARAQSELIGIPLRMLPAVLDLLCNLNEPLGRDADVLLVGKRVIRRLQFDERPGANLACVNVGFQ